MFRALLALLIVSGACGPAASAQTTRPADGGTTTAVTAEVLVGGPAAATAPAVDQEWPHAVEAFARAIAAGEVATVEAAMSARATVRRFESAQPVEPSHLTARLTKSTVVGQHAYLHPPLVMAADVAADFKNAVGIPERAKARFIVDDETDIKRANATAVQWVVEQLDARAGTPIGVIILWTPRPTVPGAPAPDGPTHDVTFVLCKGEEASPKTFKIHTVVFGVPVAENNP
jgi:hypothetical protein